MQAAATRWVEALLKFPAALETIAALARITGDATRDLPPAAAHDFLNLTSPSGLPTYFSAHPTFKGQTENIPERVLETKMALYGNLGNYQFMKETDDIRGATLYGTGDEKLGKIEDIIFDQSNGDVRYVVVDAGGWLHTRKFLVPAGEIMTREEGDNDFQVNMTKEQIERLPEYKEEELESDGLWTDYEKRYSGALADGPILHRGGSTHMITPSPAEIQPQTSGRELNQESLGEAAHHSLRRMAHDMPRFGATSNSEDSTSAGTLAGDAGRNLSKENGEYNGIDASLPRSEEEREPITMSRAEFLKEGTLRSEYDAPRDASAHREDDIEDVEIVDGPMDSASAPVADAARISPEGGNRFRAFQERLRHEREEILRRRGEKREVENKDEEAA